MVCVCCQHVLKRDYSKRKGLFSLADLKYTTNHTTDELRTSLTVPPPFTQSRAAYQDLWNRRGDEVQQRVRSLKASAYVLRKEVCKLKAPLWAYELPFHYVTLVAEAKRTQSSPQDVCWGLKPLVDRSSPQRAGVAAGSCSKRSSNNRAFTYWLFVGLWHLK